MVFSSVPLYLDPPNWQQHPNQQLQGNNTQGNENHHQHLMSPQGGVLQPLPHMGGPGGGVGVPPQIRPSSMSERARIAKIPPPEAPLKCPRCDSANTKFCYFNNYSLTQPRHFCKTCRRYWTRGGALRSVPVGGGCRRNKRSSSKSTTGGAASSSSSKSSLSSPTAAGGGSSHIDIIGATGMVPTLSGIPTPGGGVGMTSFMASLQNMSQIGMGNLGLTFAGSLHTPSHHHHALSGLTGVEHHPQLDFNVSSLLNHHHAPQIHFPSVLGGGFELPGGGSSLYSSSSSFQNDIVDDHHHQLNNNNNDTNNNNNNNNLQIGKCSSNATMMSQLAPIKMESEGQGLNLAKQLMMGISSSTTSENNNTFWGGGIVGNTNGASANMWTDLSGLNSSSTTHLM